MGFSPGEESLTAAVASQAIEAQPSFGQIKPGRGRVARAPNSTLGRRRGGRGGPSRFGRAFPGVKQEPGRTDKDNVMIQPAARTATLPKEPGAGGRSRARHRET